MKYLDEYRDNAIADKLVDEIRRTVTRSWVLMEVCGGQTHSIVKYGLDYLLPPEIELVHGPGCPVCVTPLESIDRAHAIARRSDVIFCSFGDMLRVPGTDGDLFRIRAEGANVRIVYSPMDCLKIAQDNPDKQVVFFAIGFETTAPANAMAVFQAKALGLRNFSMLVSHVIVPPAMTAILDSPDNRVQGFLGPGHVCAIMGWSEYEPIAAGYRVPIVITGFEPIDLLEGILLTVRQLERRRFKVENQYARAVTCDGNIAARRKIAQVFEVTDRGWRGIGTIPMSGYRLRDEFSAYDADRLFPVENIHTEEPAICIAGQVLRGLKKPMDCPAFAEECTPQSPLGATMVSAEGACAAYYNYGRHLVTIEAGV
ncbi:MAG TPA: hydrogenase formation protein HypD [Candidatus Sulfopaludibacter sp.]|jgi:hydrogenase expression/formation protein HypD|nr:hydrogenase formation protein HypD [Candidatus Sulfopaludibacter sp.]